MGHSESPGILLIGDYPPPMGGIAVHVQQLHRAFSRLGIQCRVLDIGKGGNAGEGIIDGHRYGTYARELFRYAAAGWTLHFHTSGNNPKAWTVALSVALTGQLFRTPTVITVHSGLVPQLFPNRADMRRRAQRALRGYTHVVTVSDAVKETLLELGVRPSRISMFPAFCASEVRPGEPSEALLAARARRRPLLAAPHHPSPVYGRMLVMEAVAKLKDQFPDVGLALFGPGTGSAEYLEDAHRFGVTDLLEDLGEVEHASALSIISKADVFVRPTTADGDSVSVREALALGVPCVATDVALRPAGTIVCRAGDAGDLAQKIATAITERPEPTAQPDCVRYLRDLYAQLSANRKPRRLRIPAPGRGATPERATTR